jgi:hypothetical protein
MKTVSLQKHNFYHRRSGAESQNEFLAFYMNTEHTSIVSKIAEDNHLDFETATAYAHAFYCALEDLFMFHQNLELPGFDVSVVPVGGRSGAKVRKWQDRFDVNLKAITEIHDDVKSGLERLHDADNLRAEKRFKSDKVKLYSEADRIEARQKAIKKYMSSPTYAALLEKYKLKRKKAAQKKLDDAAKARKRKKDKQRRRNKKAWRIKNEKWAAYCNREYFSNL